MGVARLLPPWRRPDTEADNSASTGSRPQARICYKGGTALSVIAALALGHRHPPGKPD